MGSTNNYSSILWFPLGAEHWNICRNKATNKIKGAEHRNISEKTKHKKRLSGNRTTFFTVL